ncbi:polysaccharide deacetylase family protein, partial [Clostridium perfringens]
NNPNNNELLVNPEKFKEQLQNLKDNNYTPITLDELYEYLRNNKPIPEKSVVITLDDGYKGNYEYAYPLLKEFKFTATIFVISNYVGAQDFMTADQLKEMSNNGIEIE